MSTPLRPPLVLAPCDNPRGYKAARHLCNCPACYSALLTERKRSRVRVALGQQRVLVDSELTREQLIDLQRIRFPVWKISAEAGISDVYIGDIRKGEYGRVSKPAADAIAKLHKQYVTKSNHTRAKQRKDAPRLARSRRHAPVSRTSRAVQGLMRQGYTAKMIAVRVGVNVDIVSKWAQAWYDFVSKEHEALVVAYAREVGITPGPSDVTRRRAERMGYVGLANWDDLL